MWPLRKLWHLEGLPSPASWFSGTGPHASRSKTVTMCRITTISPWFVWDGGLRLQTTHALLLGKGAGDSGLCRRRWSVLQIEQLASKGDCIKRGQTVRLAGDCVEGIFSMLAAFCLNDNTQCSITTDNPRYWGLEWTIVSSQFGFGSVVDASGAFWNSKLTILMC